MKKYLSQLFNLSTLIISIMVVGVMLVGALKVFIKMLKAITG